jgi:hypothetical protein
MVCVVAKGGGAKMGAKLNALMSLVAWHVTG